VDGLSLYDRISSTENLFSAFYEFRQGKRHKEDVPEFEYDLEKNIFQLKRELKKFTYEPLTPKVFKVSEPKARFIQAAWMGYASRANSYNLLSRIRLYFP